MNSNVYKDIVTVIFNRFVMIYGSDYVCRKFNLAMFDDLEDSGIIEFWAETLHKQKVTSKNIIDGLNNIVASHKYLPSLPEFIEACKPSRHQYSVLFNRMLDEARQRYDEQDTSNHCIILFNTMGRLFNINLTYSTLSQSRHGEYMQEFIQCYDQVQFLDKSLLQALPVYAPKLEKKQTLEDKNYSKVFLKYVMLSIEYTDINKILENLYKELPNIDKSFIQSAVEYIRSETLKSLNNQQKKTKQPHLKLVKSA